MKVIFSSLAILLAASSTLASLTTPVVPIHGVLPGAPSGQAPTVVKKDLKGRTTNLPGCNADNVLRALRSSAHSVAASSFCSTFLQSTTTITSTTVVPDTIISTSTKTVIVTSTTVDDIAVATSTIYCPAQPSAMAVTTCNYPAYGFNNYLFSSNPGQSAAACQQACLAAPNCKAYQIEEGGANYCNLFDQPTAGHVESAPNDIFYFFDRDCTQNENPICAPPAPTVPPKLRRDVPIPTYLTADQGTPVPLSRISSACSCFITAADPEVTLTSVVPQTSTTVVVTGGVTATATVVDTVVTSTTLIVVTTLSP